MSETNVKSNSLQAAINRNDPVLSRTAKVFCHHNGHTRSVPETLQAKDMPNCGYFPVMEAFALDHNAVLFGFEVFKGMAMLRTMYSVPIWSISSISRNYRYVSVPSHFFSAYTIDTCGTMQDMSMVFGNSQVLTATLGHREDMRIVRMRFTEAVMHNMQVPSLIIAGVEGFTLITDYLDYQPTAYDESANNQPRLVSFAEFALRDKSLTLAIAVNDGIFLVVSDFIKEL